VSERVRERENRKRIPDMGLTKRKRPCEIYDKAKNGGHQKKILTEEEKERSTVAVKTKDGWGGTCGPSR